MNLLERFVLQQLQLTQLNMEILHAGKDEGRQKAKIELNLTPRLLNVDSGSQLPAYQVSARLSCYSGPMGQDKPHFHARVGCEVIYQQVSGEPVDIAEFTTNHPSLSRQLYPLLQQELRVLLNRAGMDHIRLPFDLAAQVDSAEHEQVEVSPSVH